jgi:hypothetical protein
VLRKWTPLCGYENLVFLWVHEHGEGFKQTPITPSVSNIKVTFGHKLRYKIKVTFGDISLKLCQTNWDVAINNVIIVVDELPSQITFYNCLTNDI